MSGRLGTFLLREPLLHFLVLGGVLFLLYLAFGKADDVVSKERIVVDEKQLARLSQTFQRTWMRPPTREELQGLAKDFVKEEILYREALALGLDRDDLVIRRRMRQKMEFLNADLIEQQPTEADLEGYLQANPDRFRRPSRFSFQQVYLNPQHKAEDIRQRAQRLLARLYADPDLATDGYPGDPTLLPAAMKQVTQREIANTFGSDFANLVMGMQPGAWSGPYPSAYGQHLVRVTASEPGRLPTLAEALPAVEREWANERRQEANVRFYEALRSRYSIEIRLPEPDAQVYAPADTHRGGQLAARP